MKKNDLQSLVRAELKKDDRLKNELIDAVVVDSTVTLNGIVSNNKMAQIAENIVYDIEGIDSVENFLMAKVAGEDTINEDEKIKNRLINLFSVNNQLRFPNLKIIVEGGVVSITGKVDEVWKKNLIHELALETSGVKKLKNKIDVAPKLKETDEDLATKIRETIDKNYMIDSSHVNISVRKGIVKLTGEVDSSIEMRAAVNSVIYTPGVTDVSNELKVTIQ
jgi:osmotically-inducible protein OsmY